MVNVNYSNQSLIIEKKSFYYFIENDNLLKKLVLVKII